MQRQEEARQKIQENRRQRAEKKETERQTRNAGKLDADVIADRIEQRLGKLSPQDRAKLVKRVRETIHNATDLEKATSRKRFVQNLGRMSGVNIKLADLTKNGTVRSAPEGFYQSSTNTLVLDIHTTQGDAIYRVMLHELTHSIEGSGLYGEYANALLALKYGTGPEAQARINADTQAYMERYNRELPKLHEQDSSIDPTPLTPEDAQKELVADLTFDVLFKKEGGGKNDVNTAAIKQLTREHEPIAKCIWSALTRFVRKLAGINDSAVTRIEQVRDMFARALEDARANRRLGTGRDQYMFRDSNGNELTITDQEISDNKQFVAQMEPVERIELNQTNRFQTGDIVESGFEYFKEIGGRAVNPIFGDVKLDRYGLKHIAGRNQVTLTKAILIPMIKPTIEKGRIVNVENDHGGKDTLILASKVTVGTDDYLIGVVVAQMNGGTRGQENKYSFHTGLVLPIEKRTAVYKYGSVRTNTSVAVGGSSSVFKILQEIAEIYAQSGKISYSLPAEELDDDYMAAVEAGEMDEAQRMVDEAAQEAGYTVKGYHGTANEFNVFDRSRSGENWQGDSRYGPGFYFAHDSYDAMRWTDGTRIVDAWLSLNNPLDLRGATPDNIADAIRERTADGKMTDGIGEFLRGLGYDEIITNEEIVVFDPNQIKSADPITYDGTGEVIPLSVRFNDQNNDIRYSLPSDDLMDEMIRNYVGEELGEYGFPLNNNIQHAASYSQHADRHAPNNNPDHTQRMKSPQQIAKGLARKLNIGQAIGTRNMSGVPAQVLGFYEQRVRAIRVRNMNANSFVVGMHELGHGVAAQIGMQGTPEMIARLPALFAQNYSAAQLPGEAFAEFFWQYMTQENKAVPFAGQDFVDQVEQAMKDHRIYDAVQASRGEMLLWMNGSMMDRIRSVTRNRSDGVGKGIRDMMRTIVDSAVDSTYTAERVNAMIREQTK